MKYILYFHTGSKNHGCEALVRSTAAVLGTKPHLYSTGYSEDLEYKIDNIVTLHKDEVTTFPHSSIRYILSAIAIKLLKTTELHTFFSRRALLAGINKNDVCLSIGGDNYCYGAVDILGDLNKLFHRKGAKTVLWGCSIDPEVITPVVAQDLKRYDLITVRESITFQAMKDAGVSANVRRVADSAFLLEAQEVELPEGFVRGNTIGINISPLIFEYTKYKEEALTGIFDLVQEILDTTDSTIALIPHVVKPGNDDLEVLKLIYERYSQSGRIILITDKNCMQLKYIISQCRLFIGARTHATIAAYSTCVPTLVIGYSVKSRGIAIDLFGTEEHYVLPVQKIRSSEDLIKEYRWLMLHEKDIKLQLQKIMPEYREKAKLGMQYIEEISEN